MDSRNDSTCRFCDGHTIFNEGMISLSHSMISLHNSMRLKTMSFMLKLICEKLFYALPSFQTVITSLACRLPWIIITTISMRKQGHHEEVFPG